MNQPETPPSTGLVAGKYQLVTMIGRGGMGSVWEARHASLGTRFAIKFIEAEYADSQEARSRFDREARAAATIQSKHAIQIYDHGVTDDGKPYIVMELLEGEPLDKRIDRLGRVSLQDTARIIQQVCRGLARAHERGIVHRDLKPENIFLVRTSEDDDEVAKVLDFGIAKVSNSPHSPGITSSTKTGAVLGTPFYMSPEQARGLRNVDHRTDVWSLGVIAYKCVTGKLPFDGESVGDLLVKICTAPIPVPSQAMPGLPPSFDAWFMRALEREPDRRFSNVTELAEALGHAAGVAPRSALGSQHHGMAQGGGMATQPSSNQGAITPQGLGPGMVPTPPPGPSPLVGSQGGYGQPPQQGYGTGPGGSYGARTPNPAGMTNAPFTSSQPVPGVGSGKGKLVAGILGGVVVVAGIVVGVKLGMKPKEADGARLTPPPAASSVAAPAATAAKPADPPPATGTAGTVAAVDTHAATPATATAATATAKTGKTPTPAKTTPTTTAKTTPTAPATTAAPATTTTAAPTATATATAKKKPANPSDPGY